MFEKPKILSEEEAKKEKEEKEKEATEKLKNLSEAKQREKDLELLAKGIEGVPDEEYENWRKRQPDRTD